MDNGIPHGSVFGSMLFSVWTSPLTRILSHCGLVYHLYADTVSYISGIYPVKPFPFLYDRNEKQLTWLIGLRPPRQHHPGNVPSSNTSSLLSTDSAFGSTHPGQTPYGNRVVCRGKKEWDICFSLYTKNQINAKRFTWTEGEGALCISLPFSSLPLSLRLKTKTAQM